MFINIHLSPLSRSNRVKILRAFRQFFPISGASWCLLLGLAIIFLGCQESYPYQPKDKIRSIEIPGDLSVSLSEDISNLSGLTRIPAEGVLNIRRKATKGGGTTISVPKGMSIVTALEAKRFSDQQANLWNPDLELIWAFPGDTIIPGAGDGQPGPGNWVFIYKRPRSTTWLAVMAGSHGVIDVGHGKDHEGIFKDFIPIKRWEIDSDHENLVENRYEVQEVFVTITNGGKRVTVLLAHNNLAFGRKLNQAFDGEAGQTIREYSSPKELLITENFVSEYLRRSPTASSLKKYIVKHHYFRCKC